MLAVVTADSRPDVRAGDWTTRRRLQFVIAGVGLTVLVGRHLPWSPLIWSADIKQDYLQALALRDGLDIFAPSSDLQAYYWPSTPLTHHFHPSPHAPILASLFVPATIVPYPFVQLLWLALSVALALYAGRRLGLSRLGSLTLCSWPPLFITLDMGNWEAVVLVLVVLTDRAPQLRG